MKILFFSPYFYPYVSGLTMYPFNVLTHLTKKHQIQVLTFPHESKLPYREDVNGLKIIRMPYLFRLSKGYISPQSLYDFFNEVRKTDVVFINIPNFEGLFLALFAKIFNKQVICFFHCQVFLGDGIKNYIVNSFLNLSVFIQLFLSNCIIGYEDYLQSLWVGRFFFKKIKFVFPPVERLPVNEKKIHELKKIKGDKIWVGYVGRISQEKGLEYLIEAVKNLRNIELVFAGPYATKVVGEFNYFMKIQQLLSRYNVRHRFFGRLTSVNLGTFYKTIDLLVLPSINRTEAFGMVQVEAMLLGTPVIATNLPGVRIPIQLTQMGKTIKPQNIQQFTMTLEEILKNRKKYTSLDKVKKAKKIFDFKKTQSLFKDLIDELCYQKK